ncbi:hypothetical protein JI752_002195 [Lysobacter sp. MMG2]|uniref:hypothetical protein n=1 Tax=Lysobacter sp. MMG2 TaxID=2801338 RepID=UPI001C24F51D|nr:hypothetical protein [Lysobacter sp. MMG2]MBU8974943.1 hypothetical protein [Lysobacter sp. MMG2]
MNKWFGRTDAVACAVFVLLFGWTFITSRSPDEEAWIVIGWSAIMALCLGIASILNLRGRRGGFAVHWIAWSLVSIPIAMAIVMSSYEAR